MTTPLRVLIVIKGLGPGGAERLVVDQLRHAGVGIHYELFVCTAREPDLLDEVRALGVPVHLGYDGRFPWPIELRRTIGRGNFDIVHAHLPIAAVGARIAGHSVRSRPRIVYTEHNRWPSYLAPTRWLNRLTVRLDDHDIAVSTDSSASMVFPARGPVTVLTHGVDRPALLALEADPAALRAELGLSTDAVVIGTVANLRREKDQRTLLQAFADADLGATAVLAIVGQGPLEADLRAFADEIGMGDRVRFVGYRSDATAVMRAFDVFTLPSAHEGRPVALMEAMTLGLPVVVTDAGGMPDMVRHDHTGLVVPVGDVAALAEQFRRIVGDSALRAQLGAAAAEAAEAFDGSHAYAAIEATYGEMLGR